MAWQAKLSAPVTYEHERIVATFDFYDDVDPSTILAHETFVFDPNWSPSDMAASIQATGQRLRTAYGKARTLAQSFPVGTTVAIP